MNQLLDVRVAAQRLAVSPWTIRAYIRQGRLNAVRIGRLVRLDENEISRFIASATCYGAVAPTTKGEVYERQ